MPSLVSMTGLILCGGRSSRMGRSKAFLPYGRGTLIEHRLKSMHELFNEVLLVTNEPDLFSHLSVDIVKDIIPDHGPLVGILSGLVVAQHDYAFVIGCDMPLVNQELMRDMTQHCQGSDILVLCHGNVVEPLLGIYSKRCIQTLEECIFAGKNKAQDFLAGMNTKTYQFPAQFLKTGELPPYFNVNTPADYSSLLTAGYAN